MLLELNEIQIQNVSAGRYLLYVTDEWRQMNHMLVPPLGAMLTGLLGICFSVPGLVAGTALTIAMHYYESPFWESDTWYMATTVSRGRHFGTDYEKLSS